MSSNIRVQKICELCGDEFTARTTVTRYCSHKCASKAYKHRQRKSKVKEVAKETFKQKAIIETGLDISFVQQKDFLSIKEAYTILGVSESTFYRLIKSGIIAVKKIGRRTIIKRTEIDKLFIS